VRNAIVVAGHAVVLEPREPLRDESWVLLDFQRGEPPCYVGHVRCGVELAAADPGALLIFSGGQSRREAGPRSEAQGYYLIAEHLNWFGHREVAERTITEEFARDSFENLLLGICRFREYAGRYPELIAMVSWRFKARRFGLHRDAIRWPRERFRYVGANDPVEIGQALAAEAVNTAKYLIDPYSSGAEFRAKREARNPFRRRHGYLASCPELDALYRHEGPEPFEGRLPWS
jgi:hypothetical protein